MGLMAAKLREQMAADRPIVLIGSSTPLQARLVEEAGFTAGYIPGGGVAANIYGLPDTGLITSTEMTEHAKRVAQSVNIPLISDADDGYGAPTNVYRTIQKFEEAGVAGVHLEDQSWPKRCGQIQGKILVPTKDMTAKLRAAADARTDDNFVIIARCDAISVEGFDAALERARAYVDAGADVLFMEAPTSMEQLETVVSTFNVPLLLNVSSSGKTPMLDASTAYELGFKFVLFPNYVLFAGLKAQRQILKEVHSSGAINGILDRTITFKEYMELAGLPEASAREEKYGMSVSRL